MPSDTALVSPARSARPASPGDRATPHALALFRIVIGLLFACHGASSLFGVLGATSLPGGAWPGWYAAVIQLVGGTLVLFGLGTRYAALVCSGSMAYAYFSVHQSEALWPLQNGGEPSAIYAWAFLLLAVTGSGSWAVDRLIANARGGRGEGASAPAGARREPSAI
ncbi:DoxX family protein [Streptomyces sp. H27-D2]|uniref:DoxX family protein n=1 Tax=Streptomyces sp. H27-D2 TaxID=3046304 RepID=UPI002DBC0F8C|nr:DoxX family protein [Streptomyces sp. H27-D2]MEC4016213.1 DoxX family protein [Streptomyces sp. H27-D2]